MQLTQKKILCGKGICVVLAVLTQNNKLLCIFSECVSDVIHGMSV